jgi:excisionase family DNA binding protein
MSSNIQIQRVCEHCGNDFTARTTVTRFCSDACAKRAYKARQKAAKIEKSNVETRQIKSRHIDEIKAKEFLSVRDAAKLIGCSRQTFYTLINTGRINAVNIKIKKTIIPRSEINKLFS